MTADDIAADIAGMTDEQLLTELRDMLTEDAPPTAADLARCRPGTLLVSEQQTARLVDLGVVGHRWQAIGTLGDWSHEQLAAVLADGHRGVRNGFGRGPWRIIAPWQPVLTGKFALTLRLALEDARTLREQLERGDGLRMAEHWPGLTALLALAGDEAAPA